MIKEGGKYYLYRHTRLDTNEVFYIGIGSTNKFTRYKRAIAKDGRNDFWKRIVAKTNYRVDILIETDSLEFLYKKEIEFIALYGRRDLGLGTLTNLTDGGEGNHGYIPSKEQIENFRKKMSGRKASEETKEKQSLLQRGKFVDPSVGAKISISKTGKTIKKSDNKSKRILHIPTNQVFRSIESAAKEFNIRPGLFGRDLRKGKLIDFKHINEEEFLQIVKETKVVFKKKVLPSFTEERKKKLSKKLKGRKHTEESKKRMSDAQKSKTLSEEAKKNISLCNYWNVKIRHIFTGEIFYNISEGAKKHNIEPPTLANQLKKGYGNCLFEYVDRKNNKKPFKFLRNKNTLELFENIKDAAKSVGISESCLFARLSRNSVKNEFEYFYGMYSSDDKTYLKSDKENERN